MLQRRCSPSASLLPLPSPLAGDVMWRVKSKSDFRKIKSNFQTGSPQNYSEISAQFSSFFLKLQLSEEAGNNTQQSNGWVPHRGRGAVASASKITGSPQGKRPDFCQSK
jgi:hypothetical protein